MGISNAVEWWEEWQLRILVLGSLFVQYLLFISAPWRKFALPFWFRSIIWLAYLGSDALAIYALATLFNRQSKQEYYSSAQGNSLLEVVWAPVLLMHLGGQDVIAAYNIEDNELWTRHILTAVSQVTVAIYVFFKSWSGSDKRLLQAAILFFIPGILKCLEKPWALKNASINCLVSSSYRAPRRTKTTQDEINSLENYVQRSVAFVHTYEEPPEAEEIFGVYGTWLKRLQFHSVPPKFMPFHLFVDLASPYPDRVSILNSFRALDEKKVYDLLQLGLSDMFNILYTKETLSSPSSGPVRHPWQLLCGSWIRISCLFLPFTAIICFHKSNKDAYNSNDVKITYALFCCTAVLEAYSVYMKMFVRMVFGKLVMPESTDLKIPIGQRLFATIAQYSLIGFFVRNRRHTKKLCTVCFFQCKDFLDQHWCMKPCASSFVITKLVLEYVKKGWTDQIKDAASYWKFNDRRGQWTLQDKCDQDLVWSLRRPFDESVLLWHIATDFCYLYVRSSSGHQCATGQCIQDASGQSHECAVWCERSPRHRRAVQCREISNYMIYLLFVNPEMLLSGTRQNLFTAANAQLEKILKDDKPLVKKIFKGDKPSLVEILKGEKSFLKFLKGKRPSLKEIERGLMQIITNKMQSTECREEIVGCTESTTDAQEGFIHDAWKLSQALLVLGDEKMWEVIEGVWVEMLCFSASRCRGYLHAKSMGTGVELLTYIWLLLSHMGMETLPERLQRTELSSGEGNASDAPSTSLVSTTTGEDIV